MDQSSAFRTLADVKRANAALGHHWFSPATLRFFDSRIESDLIGGRYFITSEQFTGSDGASAPRTYSVWEAEATGGVETPDALGGHGGHASVAAALDAVTVHLRHEAVREAALAANGAT